MRLSHAVALLAFANSRLSQGMEDAATGSAAITIDVGDRPARESALDIPTDEWTNTAIRLPRPLLDRLTAASKKRGIGRNVLLAHLLEPALDRLEDRPILGN